jgi:hypothetical protein
VTDFIEGSDGDASAVPPAGLSTTTDLSQWLAVALAVAIAIRVVASVVAGLIKWARPAGEQFGVDNKFRAGTIILDFVRFGDGVGALLVLALAAALYWHVRTHGAWYAGRGLAIVGVGLAALTAVAALLSILGYALYLSRGSQVADTMVAVVGEGLAYALVASAAAVAIHRLTWRIDEQLAVADPEPSETDDDVPGS